MQTLKYLTDKENNALQDFINSITDKYSEHIDKIILFGSKARGDFNQDSDIDILIVTNSQFIAKEINGVAFDILLKYGVYISLKVMDKAHFEKINIAMTGFSQNINREGITLWKSN